MAYLEEQRSKGLDTKSLRLNLMSFDEHLVRTCYSSVNINKATYDDWLGTLSHLNRITIYSKTTSVTRVLIYINKLGYNCYVPRPQKCPRCDFIPYIYSEADMEKIFKAADEWRDIMLNAKSSVFVMPVLLRLLYSTGIRIGEALALNNGNIDFEHHVIHLHDTKNKCDRLAPINPSLELVLRQYIQFRNQLPINGVGLPDAPFFVTLQGNRCKHGGILRRFKDILMAVRFPVAPNGNLPRIHDIRHSACVHAMVKLVDNGKDIYCALPILSVFMGHRKPESTEYYVRLTQEMYPTMLTQDSTVTSSIKRLISNISNFSEDESI